jgi:hypothetical protein
MTTGQVMAGLGVLSAAPIAAVMIRRGRSGSAGPDREDLNFGQIATSKALSADYWRDNGHPPFMKPSEAEPDKQMFDPNKLV